MKRASYREAVRWIAYNDNPGDDMPTSPDPDDEANVEILERISGYISTLLVVDLCDVARDRVARDIFRARVELAKEMELL